MSKVTRSPRIVTSFKTKASWNQFSAKCGSPVDWQIASGSVLLFCTESDRDCQWQIVPVGAPIPEGMGVFRGVRVFKGKKVILASTCIANV